MSVTAAVWKMAVGGSGESGGEELQAPAMSVVTVNSTQFVTMVVQGRFIFPSPMLKIIGHPERLM